MNPLKIAHTWRKENSSMPEILVTFKTLLSASKFSHESFDFKGWGKRILRSHGLHSQRRWLSGIIIGITAPPPPHCCVMCFWGHFFTWKSEFNVFCEWCRDWKFGRDTLWSLFLYVKQWISYFSGVNSWNKLEAWWFLDYFHVNMLAR